MILRAGLKNILLLLLTIGLLMSAAGQPSYAAGATSADLRLWVNGTEVKSDVPPLIRGGRTLVPVRGVFESIGGAVNWDSGKRQAIVRYQSNEVVLTIGSATALINGTKAQLDVPAQIINKRTLIPLRFVGESLGFLVDWDALNRIASINPPPDSASNLPPNPTPNPTPNPMPSPGILGSIEGISVTAGSTKASNTVVTISATTPINGGAPYKTLSLTEPNRFAVDCFGFKLGSAATDQSWADETSPVTLVRAGQTTGDTVRLVVDLKEAAKPTVSLSPDGCTLTLTFARYSAYFKPLDDGRLVVMLDPGHGITTAGKQSPDGSIREYAFNRDIAGRVKTLLEAQGIEVMTTVSDDSDLSLADRVATANRSAADIFVSLHANAYGSGSEWTPPNGWEVYYCGGSVLGQKLAKAIEEATVSSSGLYNRGVKASDFYVIKYTAMPAVLIEHGFYTNIVEIETLKSDAWRDQIAQCDAAGILRFLNSYR